MKEKIDKLASIREIFTIFEKIHENPIFWDNWKDFLEDVVLSNI